MRGCSIFVFFDTCNSVHKTIRVQSMNHGRIDEIKKLHHTLYTISEEHAKAFADRDEEKVFVVCRRAL
jgi:septal ring factor EnvC (AmiA/AmiB activator)